MKKMRNLKIGICVLLTCFSVSVVSAQNCKPDNSKLDKITKQRLDEWSSVLYAPNMLNLSLNSSNVKYAASILRMGDINKLAIVLIRTQDKETSPNVQQYKAVKGNEFYFGIKDGTPLKLTADEVSVTSDVVGGIVVNKIILFSYVKDEDLKTLKDLLTVKPIDAIRVLLENGVVLEQSVKDKDGAKMMSKFICFFNYAQEKGYLK